ncbi:MAG TPA: winged helix-turn-helix domain-containing protein [Acidobacteriaceae bacterium]
MATSPLAHAARVAFGDFELDLRSEELWRGSRRVRCQRQPFRVLCALIERPGELVSRDELQSSIWGGNSPADADHSLGIAINKLREALGDSAESPRFIETLSRRGYRFVAAITVVSESEASLERQVPAASDDRMDLAASVTAPRQVDLQAAAVGPADNEEARPPHERHRGLPVAAAIAVALGIALGGLGGFLLARTGGSGSATPRRIDQVSHNDSIFPGVPAMESFPVVASDGTRLYSSTLENGETQIASVDPGTGEMQPLRLPAEIVNPTLSDISPDGSRLLVRSHPSSGSEQPIWVVPRNGGSALRLGNVEAHDAVWMPDGKSILYARGNDLELVRLDNESTSHFASLPGRPFWMRWSPDGKLLRLTVLDALSHTSSLWEVRAGSRPRSLLDGWTRPASECCGVWTGDGESYVFQSSHDQGSDLWRLGGTSTREPEKLTNGPLSFAAPVVERGSRKIYFVGLDARSELERFDKASKKLVSERGYLSDATRICYSRDRQWVAWTDVAGRLWRSRAEDGSAKVQLTPDLLQTFLAQWSPDGHHLLAMAREPGRAWQLYLVNADGGVPVPLLKENRNQGDPTWSADGSQVAFGRTPDLMGQENGSKQIQVLDLRTHAFAALPGSEGFFSPRWSPNGRWIAALSLGEQRVMLYDTANRTWTRLGDLRGADPVWSSDSSALYVHSAFVNPQSIERVSIPSGRAVPVAELARSPVTNRADYVFVGITAQEEPMLRVRTTTGNLYRLDLQR